MLVLSEVTYDIKPSLCRSRLQFSILTRPKTPCALCVLLHMPFFFLLNSAWFRLWESLAFIWKLMLSWSEEFHIQHLKQERHHCVLTTLNHCYWSGRLFCSSTQYIQSTGNILVRICHFQTSGTSFSKPSFTVKQWLYSSCTESSLFRLCTAKCIFDTNRSHIKTKM